MRSVHVKCQFPQLPFCCCLVWFGWFVCLFFRACVCEENGGSSWIRHRFCCELAGRIIDPTTTSLKWTTSFLL